MAKQNEELAALAAMVDAVDKATDALEKLILLRIAKEDGSGCIRDEDPEKEPEIKEEEKTEEKNAVTVFELSDRVAESSGLPRFLIYVIISEALDVIRDNSLAIIREKEQSNDK